MIERSRARVPAGAADEILLQGQLSVLTLISVSVPSSFTAVARKLYQSFCQKCRWQVKLNTHVRTIHDYVASKEVTL